MHVFDFYSHTPHGVQPSNEWIVRREWEFLLTHPLRGATHQMRQLQLGLQISTHTPLAGCNGWQQEVKCYTMDFYSHTPCGVQLVAFDFFASQRLFLLTHPLRGATRAGGNRITATCISTHTPLAGCNHNHLTVCVCNGISTHTPLAGCNGGWGNGFGGNNDFYSHTPCGVQLLILKYLKLYPDFYSHTPCGVQLKKQNYEFLIKDFYSHTPCGVQH